MAHGELPEGNLPPAMMTVTVRRDSVETRLSVPMVLAQQIIDLLEDSGTSRDEQDTALDIAHAVVRHAKFEA